VVYAISLLILQGCKRFGVVVPAPLLALS